MAKDLVTCPGAVDFEQETLLTWMQRLRGDVKSVQLSSDWPSSGDCAE